MEREREIYKGTQQFVGEYLNGLYDTETLAKKCAQWADAHPISPWISVEERLPKVDTKVYVVTNTGYVTTDNLYVTDIGKKRWWLGEHEIVGYCDDKVKITHWMPIPKPPKNEF